MFTVQQIIDTFLTDSLINDMGECAYQRLVYTLGVALPCLYLAFGMVCVLLLLYAVYRLVVRK